MSIKKVLRLFTYSYIFLYIFPDVFNYIPGISFIAEIYMDLFRKVVLYFGQEILNIEDLVFQKSTGSGDTQFDYVRILFIIIVSFFTAIIGSLFPTLKTDRIGSWITIYCRYYLGFILIYYGMAKFQNQFPSLSFYTLENKVGDMSPSGLLWTFMGHSSRYTLFTGLVEMLAGYLLLFSRTTIFGALLGLLAMVQVWVLNMTFDVPVKIASFHYLLFCIFIVWPYFKSIYLFFFTGNAVAIEYPVFQFKNARFRKVKSWIKMVTIGLIVLVNGLGVFQYLTKYSQENKSVGFIPENDNGVSIFYEKENNGTIVWPNAYGMYRITLDSANSQIVIADWNDSTQKYNITYKRLSDSTTRLQGILNKDTVDGIYKIKYKKDYPLNSRGFRWVTEFPFIR